MAERSFVEEVKKLRLSSGETFSGEGILAVTKALLESGVAYVAGYQGAPVSHLMDVLADAQDILDEYQIRFENSANEATAAATLAASVNYPLRGAVTFKSPVGTNVAADALSNLSSSGVKGGALIIIGEDYGEGSSIIQESTYAYALKSQIWLLDPRPDLSNIVGMVKHGFALSEASNTPVMLELRIRACHVYGRFTASDNVRSPFSLADALEQPQRDVGRIPLPPATYAQEQEKLTERLPAAVAYIHDQQLNELFNDRDDSQFGLVLPGGLYNNVLRVLNLLGLADVFGNSQIPLYVLNVTYPLIPEEIVRFSTHKKAVLLIEEGQPKLIEQGMARIVQQHGLTTDVYGNDYFKNVGEYTTAVLLEALARFCQDQGIRSSATAQTTRLAQATNRQTLAPLAGLVHNRPPGFCTGCPERPIFAAMKLVAEELGEHHISADIGCHLFAILPPFNIGSTTMGYGLGTASASALHVAHSNKKAISIMGDGGFWHNGLTSGIANAVFNRNQNLTIVVDNSYTSATGGQAVLSSQTASAQRRTGLSIKAAVKGVGVKWVKLLTRTYDITAMRRVLKQALSSNHRGPKVIIAQSECMLNRQRRLKTQRKKEWLSGRRQVHEKFGVDGDLCTGDHACIRLSGCPSLSITSNPDPLRSDPVTTVLDSCVACGMCGEAAHSAILCPSFYKIKRIDHPNRWDKWRETLRRRFIDYWRQKWHAKYADWQF